jgi:hypothetical protein
MNKSLIIGISTAALALGLGMSTKAQAAGGPTYACTAQTQGAIFYDQTGPYNFGGAYQIEQWECWNSKWYRTELYLCEYYGPGSGCIQM